MALPGKQSSKSRKRGRIAQLKLGQRTFSVCPKCKKPTLPHHVCPHCGWYRGRAVLEIKSRVKKGKKKKEEKEEKQEKK